jgi:hypothetical protein
MEQKTYGGEKDEHDAAFRNSERQHISKRARTISNVAMTAAGDSDEREAEFVLEY